jgi:hypothetical protein
MFAKKEQFWGILSLRGFQKENLASFRHFIQLMFMIYNNGDDFVDSEFHRQR